MTAAKRFHPTLRQAEGGANDVSTHPGPSNLPASKRLKSSHLPTAKSPDLGFLIEEKGRDSKSLDAKLTNGIANRGANQVDESHTVVTADADQNGPTLIDAVADGQDVSSDGSDYGQDEDMVDDRVQINGFGLGEHRSRREEASRMGRVDDAHGISLVNGDEHAGNEEDSEPSFGDRLKNRHPHPITVHRNLPEPQTGPPHARPISGRDALIRPVAGHSLTTVLQQALKTNDKDMLEQCFQLKDLQAIHNTIDRLRPPTVVDLLSRIADRMYHRPGRTGSLMEWLRWSLVAHGGYLTTQPETLRKMRALNRVIRQRAQGLQPLLQLKGKLDMLTAQLEVRRSGLDRRLHADLANEENMVMYMEGYDDDVWENADDAQGQGSNRPQASSQTARINGRLLDEDEEEDAADEASLADRMPDEGDLESVDAAEDEDEDRSQIMFDVEAEESDDEEEARDDEDELDSDGGTHSEELVEDGEHDDDISDNETKPARLHTMDRKR